MQFTTEKQTSRHKFSHKPTTGCISCTVEKVCSCACSAHMWPGGVLQQNINLSQFLTGQILNLMLMPSWILGCYPRFSLKCKLKWQSRLQNSGAPQISEEILSVAKPVSTCQYDRNINLSFCGSKWNVSISVHIKTLIWQQQWIIINYH